MPQPQQQQTDDPAMIAAQEINTNVFSGQGYRGAEDDIAAIIRTAHAALTAERDMLAGKCAGLMWEASADRGEIAALRESITPDGIYKVIMDSDWDRLVDSLSVEDVWVISHLISTALAGDAPR